MAGDHTIKLFGFGWKAEIAPFWGMNPVKLSYKGKPVLYSNPEPASPANPSPMHAGSPLLFPGNRTANAKFVFDGRTYYMPMNEARLKNNIHGKLFKSTFRILEHTHHCVRAVYRNIGELFPFPFDLTVHYYLDRTGFHQEFSFQNTGVRDMPINFGLHTNFVTPQKFSVPLENRWELTAQYTPSSTLLPLTEQEQQFCTGYTEPLTSFVGFYTSAGTTVQVDNILYTVSDNFDQWLLWTGERNKDLLCIRPNCGAVNNLNSGINLLRLAPGETETFTTWFHPAE